jgi:hypothetical protein
LVWFGLVWFGLVWFGYVSSWLFKEMKSGMPDLFVSSMFQISEVRQSRRINHPPLCLMLNLPLSPPGFLFKTVSHPGHWMSDRSVASEQNMVPQFPHWPPPGFPHQGQSGAPLRSSLEISGSCPSPVANASSSVNW